MVICHFGNLVLALQTSLLYLLRIFSKMIAKLDNAKFSHSNWQLLAMTIFYDRNLPFIAHLRQFVSFERQEIVGTFGKGICVERLFWGFYLPVKF